MWAYQLKEPGCAPAKVVAEVVEPGAGEVLVRLKACSLNARDLGIQAGHFPAQWPLVPLSDGAGVVESVGPNVTTFKEGDKVCTCFYPFWESGEANATNHQYSLGCELPGVLAERVVLPESALVPAPSQFTFAEAATLPCAALTAWSALFTEGQLKPGQHVLIQGTGGVATFALQFAKMAGATVTVISSSDKKLELARSLGADETINYIQNPEWGSMVHDNTGQRGVDIVIELGGAETINQSLACIKIGGRICVIGVLSGTAAQISISDLLFRHVYLTGITVGHRGDFVAMNAALNASSIRPVIDRLFGPDEIAEAYQHMAQGKFVGKVGIEY